MGRNGEIVWVCSLVVCWHWIVNDGMWWYLQVKQGYCAWRFNMRKDKVISACNVHEQYSNVFWCFCWIMFDACWADCSIQRELTNSEQQWKDVFADVSTDDDDDDDNLYIYIYIRIYIYIYIRVYTRYPVPYSNLFYIATFTIAARTVLWSWPVSLSRLSVIILSRLRL